MASGARPIADPAADRRSGREALAILGIGVALPVFATLVLSVWVAGVQDRRRNEVELQQAAMAAARAVDLKLEIYRSALLALADSDALVRAFDLAIVEREAQAISRRLGGWFVLATAGERLDVLMMSAEPGVSAPAPAPEPREAYPEVEAAEQASLAADQPAVSDAFMGRMVRRPIVTIATPVRTAAGEAYFLYYSFDVSTLSALLAGQVQPPGGFLAIADGARRIIARSSEPERFAMRLVPRWYVEATRGRIEGLLEGALHPAAGEHALFAFQRLSVAPRWTLAAAYPAPPPAFFPGRMAWPALLTLGVCAICALLAGAILRGRRAARAAALAEARACEKEALLERLRALEAGRVTLIAALGHELRAPLASVIAALDVMRPEAGAAGSAVHLVAARAAATALLALTDELLEFARLGSGIFRLEPEPFDAGALLADVAAIVRPAAALRATRVSVLGGHDLPRLVGDPKRIRQIVLNFATNAVKATDRGEIVLAAAACAMPDGRRMIEFSVRDSGIGIAEADMPTLFEEFLTLEGSDIHGVRGFGLGLAIARRLATAMDGDLGVESRPGAGARFWCRLPLPDAAATGPSG